MSERKMATIQEVAEIKAIEGADAICAYRINGWWIVDQIGNYKVGDLAVYCEIDSWIPTELAPFLSKGKEPREFEGVKGEKLRTIRLKGQVSQGLLLPITLIPRSLGFEFATDKNIGEDVSEWLGIKKYEAPISPQLAGLIKGNFPSFLRKTDQERIQNFSKSDFEKLQEHGYEVTEKLEGSSMTVYFNNGEFGVCSRNLDLKRDENNTFWATALAHNLEEILLEFGNGCALQGELIGPGIQDNIYKLSKHEFRVFDIFDIGAQEYLGSDERVNICNMFGLSHVPIVNEWRWIDEATVQDMVASADGKSAIGMKPNREGLVFKSLDGKNSFKVISNLYLLKQ